LQAIARYNDTKGRMLTDILGVIEKAKALAQP
jgi:hypothetical protein